VDHVNKKRLQLRVIDRHSTDLVDRMKKEDRKKPILRRNTEVVDLNEYMSSRKARSPEARNDWQNPGVEFLYPYFSLSNKRDDSMPAIIH
jgi:hypothetical protein